MGRTLQKTLPQYTSPTRPPLRKKCRQPPAPTISTSTTTPSRITTTTSPPSRNQPTTNPSNQPSSHPLCVFPLSLSLSLSLSSFFLHQNSFQRPQSKVCASRSPSASKNSERRCRTKSVSPVENKELIQTAEALCSTNLETIRDLQLRMKLKSLLDLEKIRNKKVCNPFNFRSTLMVVTFVRLSGSRT